MPETRMIPRWIRRLFGDVSQNELDILQQQRAEKRGSYRRAAKDKAVRKRRAARKNARAHRQYIRRRGK